ncbi:MAG: SMP-30/gluconolactonase/LRE family protein [Cytophagales bacterium]|nr:SMP-30/gluconolactonase/LRE family protein [Bernardetiaceae bacterium]MDW8210843.1 SMP-30/gluconolactonase/LRE family protein [Cytophagales bacterium]
MSCTTKQANQESVGMNCPTIEAQPILAAGALLGEGAFWHHQRQQLWWIDIEKGLLHLFTPASNSWQTYSMGKRIGTVVPDKEGNAIVALQDGIFRYNFSQQTFQLLAAPEKDKPQNRFNDGKCDPVGRLWAGTMAIDGSGRNGALYCLEGEGKITKKIDSVGISNGIVWTSDSKQMYYIDTPTGQVCAYDYDAQTGQIRFSKVAVEIPQGAGYPDGMAIDSENMIWVALWEGGGVMRFNPKTGKPLLKVITPGAWRVTSCAFGGEHLNELYITTASIGLTQEQKKQYPNSGHVFKVTLQGIKGVPMPIFAF